MSDYNVDTSGRFPIKAWTGGVQVAKATMRKFVARASRLYEQEPGEAEASARSGLYVQRWVTWARAGLSDASPGIFKIHRQTEAIAVPRPVIAS